MQPNELFHWLKEDREENLQPLWLLADQLRLHTVGPEVHLRGLIEISNHCRRSCAYCGIRSERKELPRYRMHEQEIYTILKTISQLGYGTVVLQSGEDPNLSMEWICRIIHYTKENFGLAITLSLGEQPEAWLKAWRQAGADRYLLRIETTDENLYQQIHPGNPFGTRRDQLIKIKNLGYEIGSGIMVGIPGQTFQSVIKDLEWFRSMDMDMLGIGPYIPHPSTPLAAMVGLSLDQQVPATELMANKIIALARLCCPEANIPATSALAAINPIQGYRNGLVRGANVIMPDMTPGHLRALYEIYPGRYKARPNEPEMNHTAIIGLIQSINRTIGQGPGSRKHFFQWHDIKTS